MKDLLERLKAETLICDGAMGTSLQSEGLGPGDTPEEWNITHPDTVRSIHSCYIKAGADIVITNTFGANPIKLKRAGLEGRLSEFNAAGVRLAKEAAQDNAYVFGDIGPTGEFMEPLGAYTYGQFYEFFLMQAKILYEGGADAFIIETMTDTGELKAAVSACRAAGSIPVAASMTFQPAKQGFKTMMGVAIDRAVNEMLAMGCDIIGSNCGCGSGQMLEIIRCMRKALDDSAGKGAFLMAQANAGMPKLSGGKTVFDETPADFAKIVPEFIAAGVNIIGGCCGTTAEHIREIAKAVKGAK